MDKAKVLIVDDEPGIRFFLREALGREGYACTEAADGRQALDRVEEDRPDVVVLDLKMPRMGGMEALREIRVLDPDIAVIIVTAFGTRETAFEALREGAYDFFTKPVDINEVRVVVGRAAERVRLLRTLHRVEERDAEAFRAESIIGVSASVLKLRELLSRVAPSDSTVLITGESGTGKELAAKVLHFQSRRKGGPFVAVNCAAIPESLLEAELFGHEKGAFTGAHQRRIGKFEAADGGTVFLDEIGEMPPVMQTKVLRVLQDHTFERVGGVKPVRVDIRLIAATNRNLTAAVNDGSFREDLYYRLHVVPIHIPPLRERREDIPVLAEFLLIRHVGEMNRGPRRLSQRALALLGGYRWPGNVRELDNILQRALLLSQREEISEAEMAAILSPGEMQGAPGASAGAGRADAATGVSLSLQGAVSEAAEQIEKQMIQAALEAHGGRRQDTADALKISRKSLHNKMKKYGIE